MHREELMRVAFDMTHYRVVGLHWHQDILHGLVYLECGNVKDVLFADTESPYFLAGVKPLQMQHLFNNITGETKNLTFDEARAAVLVAVETMKPMLVDDQELDKQIVAVEKQLTGKPGEIPFFRYHLGGRVPKVADSQFVRTVVRDDKQRYAAQAAAQRLQPLPAALPYTPRPAGTVGQKTGVLRATGAEPTGGVAGQVWETADAMWKAAGSPKDVKVVLALRMEMMKVLETEHDVKRTTSSNTLGQWMKARLS
jgi:hypothetical protein